MTRRYIGAVTLLWVACAQISIAQAQPLDERAIEQGRNHLKRANELYEAGEFKLALAEFERAYAVAPNYRILYNIGQMHLQLNSYAAALAAFEKFLTEGGDEIEAERRAAVMTELPRLRARTGTLSVTSNVSGAEVRVDGVVVGVTPFAGVRLDAGVHTVILTKDGRSTSEVVTVGGDDSQVALELELKLPDPAPPPTPAPAPVARPLPQPKGDASQDEVGTGVWVTWSITGALTVAAVGTGVAALLAQRAHQDKIEGVISAADLQASRDKALRLSIATDVLIGAALVSGAVSVIVTVVDVADEPKVEAALQPMGASLRVSF